jgi:hypothetical protein
MSEQANVQESIQADDGASSVDATPTAGTAVSAQAASAAHQGTGAGESGETSHPGALIAEAKRYRKRAQAAEQSLEEAKVQLAEREAAISEHQQTIAALQRRQAIDDALREAGAMDLEAARTLAEGEMSQSAALDAASAVQELARSRPYLFRQSRRAMSAGVQCARSDQGEAPREQRLTRAAEDAQSTGTRGDVLRYLRLRRKTKVQGPN